MPPLDRRTFLRGAAGAAALTAASGTATGLAGPAFSAALQVPVDAVFQYGVASGDPLPGGVIIWTRVTPSPEATPGSGAGAPTTVQWVVAEDAGLQRAVRRGTVRTSPDSDHTVKIDVTGLAPDRAYFYGFTVGGSSSPVGSTRTAPAEGASPAILRFGMVSCSNFTGGFFSAYRLLADRDDLDFVVHLGDYLYEYGNGEDRYGPDSLIGVRDHDPATEMVSLSDYRRRHANYKADPDLSRLHGKYAFITTFDDHEVTNDTWREGAENHQPETEGEFVPRRNDAYQAYDEWMPIRLPAGRTEQEMRIYRRLRFGTLADLTMLDLRQYRDEQTSPLDGETIDDPDRVMTGPEQQGFLEQGLAAPGSPAWRLIGNPVQIMQVKTPPLPAATAAALAALQGGGTPVSLPQSGFSLLVDPWDGYTANRQRVLDFALAEGVGDPVFLTGDIHTTWAADLPIDPGTYTGSPTGPSPSAGVEFVCPSITSDNLDEITGSPPRTTSIAVEEEIKVANRHIKEVELDSHGYSVVDVTGERIQFDTYHISEREDPEATQEYYRGFMSLKDSRTVVPAAEPIPTDRADRPAAQPAPSGSPSPSASPGGGSGGGSAGPAAAGAAAPTRARGGTLAATGMSDALPALAGAGLLAGALRWRASRLEEQDGS
jgi:alkaline phosphatase D